MGEHTRLNQSGAGAQEHSLGVARYWLRAALPRRWRAWLLLGILVGLLGGGVIAALAGARRTESAYQRFLAATDAWDVAGAISCDPTAPPSSSAQLELGGEQGDVEPPSAASQSECVERFRALPSVVDVTSVNQYGAQFAPVDGKSVQPTADTCYSGPGLVNLIGDPTGRFGTQLNRFKIVDGRAADPTVVDEVVISREAALRLGLRPGDVIETTLVSYQQCLDNPAAWPAPMHLTVVGTSVAAWEVQPSSGFFVNFVTTTPAFVRAAGTDALDGSMAVFRLRRGTDADALPSFVAEVERSGMLIEPQLVQTDYRADLERGIRPSVQALWILGTLAAIAGVAVLGQLLMRQTALEAIDLPQVRSLGASRRQRFAVATAWSVPVSIVAALTALVAAGACSWLTPIGVARIVEPDRGLSIDALVLSIGGILTAAVVLLFATAPAVRLARSTSSGVEVASDLRPSRTVAVLAQASFPPAAMTGVRMALEPGRGRSTVPVRSSLLAIAVGVLTLTASATFGAGLATLLDTPRLVGWNWDSRVGYPYDVGTGEDDGTPVERAEVIEALAAHPDVIAYGLGNIFTPGLELGEERIAVGLMSFDPGAGSVGPSIIEGRAPAAPDELLLGPVTADVLGIDVGDEVVAYGRPDEWEQAETSEDTEATMQVVGLGVLPLAGDSRLGNGAAVTTDGLGALAGLDDPDSVFLRYAPGAEPTRVVGELVADLGLPEPDPGALAEELSITDAIPLLDVRQVDQLPLLLGALMALMSAAVLAHVLVSATSARRREIGVLRAIGFDRRQVRRTVAWQAATIAAIALLVGVPIGVVVGRTVWLVFAERLGVVPEATVPFTLVLIVPLVMLTARLIAAAPAWMAARQRPAVVLRAE